MFALNDFGFHAELFI